MLNKLNYPNEPTQCYACKRLILPNQRIHNHHVTYYPEFKVSVHMKCHSLIHVRDSRFPHLKPDLRQSMRWARQKKLRRSTFYNSIFWEGYLIDCMEWVNSPDRNRDY